MLAIPYTAKFDFCFLTPNGINMKDWPSLAMFFILWYEQKQRVSVCRSTSETL